MVNHRVEKRSGAASGVKNQDARGRGFHFLWLPAVLFLSLELEEILSLADRILVIFEGQIVGEYGVDATEEELGIAMAGGRRPKEAAA